MGAVVTQFSYDGGWPKKKNWALRTLPLRNEWVLIVDADERVSPALWDEIAEAIRRPSAAGYYVRWKFIFLGRWMKHAWSHGWMLRLFRKGAAEYEDLGMRGEGGWDNEVHENLVLNGNAGFLKEPLLHASNQNLSEWIRKQNDFADWNARRRLRQAAEPMPPLQDAFSLDPRRRRRWMKALFLRLPLKCPLLFIYLYVFRRGFLDGRAGFYFCALRAMHELNINAKMYELRSAMERGRRTPSQGR